MPDIVDNDSRQQKRLHVRERLARLQKAENVTVSGQKERTYREH